MMMMMRHSLSVKNTSFFINSKSYNIDFYKLLAFLWSLCIVYQNFWPVEVMLENIDIVFRYCGRKMLTIYR